MVELAVEPGELRMPEREERPPYELDPSFEFPLERLHFLVWANNYDNRDGELVWWHGRKAAGRDCVGMVVDLRFNMRVAITGRAS